MSDKYIGKYTELEAIEGCIAGKSEFHQLLYRHFSPKMFGVCLRYAQDYHSAEDLLQEGFIKVFKYLKNFRREGSFEGWMRRIFVNQCIEQFRKRVFVYPILDEEGSDIEILDTSVHFDIETQDLLQMIQDLSPGYRTIFNLYAIEGYTHREIGEQLGISEGTSKSQLARARKILQQKVIAAEQLPAQVAANS